jgi:hypothetical protein
MTLIIFWLGLAVVTAIVASSKGRFSFGWFLLGCIFPLFALILVALMPAVKKPDPLAPSPTTHVRCPDCREFVYKDASKCKHCGITLVPQTN